MAQIDVCIEEHLDEVVSSDLIEEIEGRGYRVIAIAGNNLKNTNKPIDSVVQMDDIRRILGVKKWQGTERIKEALDDLIKINGG